MTLEESLKKIAASVDAPLSLFVRIPDSLNADERMRKFDDPIEDNLQWLGLGTITGGATRRADADEGEDPPILYCGIEVDLYDVVRGVPMLCAELRSLDAPRGTQIELSLEGEPFTIDVWEAESYLHES